VFLFIPTKKKLRLPQMSGQAASMGWSAILSSLKSLLETGEPLASTTKRWKG
jgi:hypothetical protein